MINEPEMPFEALEPEAPWEAIGNRVCAEPVHIGRLMEQAAGPLMRGLPAPDAAKHPYDGLCRMCNSELDVKWIHLDRCEGWFPVNIHTECLPAYYASIGTAGAQGEQWKKICPPEYRKPWDFQKGNENLRKRVLAFDPKLRRGLLIHGPSGSCKTRAAWLLLRQLMENGFAAQFVASIDLPDENMRDMMHIPVLVIDDLGNDRMQAKAETTVLKVIRHRVDWELPTIVTTQFTGASFEERFSDGHTAKAVIRRLRDYCEDVHT